MEGEHRRQALKGHRVKLKVSAASGSCGASRACYNLLLFTPKRQPTSEDFIVIPHGS